MGVFDIMYKLYNAIIFYIRKIIYKHKINVICKRRSYFDLNSYCEGSNILNQDSRLFSSSIGFGSYIGYKTILIGTHVGRYSSIGSHVSIIVGQHPSNTFVSTHPAFYSIRKQAGFTFVDEQKFVEYKYFDSSANIRVKIGNDVWIGDNAKIIEGIEIGDGAIIATGALVTKNVQPYTIVGGVPAKVIGRRFSEQDINFLLDLDWWNKGNDWIKDNAQYFHDLEELKTRVRREAE